MQDIEVKPEVRFKNPHRISIKAWRKLEGLADEDEFMERLGEIVSDCVCPVMCAEGCDDVEPDGHCEHGCPSLLIAAGMI